MASSQEVVVPLRPTNTSRAFHNKINEGSGGSLNKNLRPQEEGNRSGRDSNASKQDLQDLLADEGKQSLPSQY